MLSRRALFRSLSQCAPLLLIFRFYCCSRCCYFLIYIYIFFIYKTTLNKSMGFFLLLFLICSLLRSSFTYDDVRVSMSYTHTHEKKYGIKNSVTYIHTLRRVKERHKPKNMYIFELKRENECLHKGIVTFLLLFLARSLLILHIQV